MENTAIKETAGLSPFIEKFFDSLLQSDSYSTLVEAPFKDGGDGSNLFAYINFPLIEDYLREVRKLTPGEMDTLMSNGLEWVNATVGRYQDTPVDGDPKELAHLYVNLLALLAGTPVTFMKLGALMMLTSAPDSVKGWISRK